MRNTNVFTFIAIFLISSVSFAVDQVNHLGLGFSQQMGSVDLPMITAHYYPNPRFAISAALGIDTKKDDSKFGALLKVRRIVLTENQMNFYMGASGGLTSHEELDGGSGRIENRSNTELSAILGGEFFFAGLESLAFMFETGIGVITGDGGTRFRTIGDHPFSAGIIFYF
jgi:hypothetical protein